MKSACPPASRIPATTLSPRPQSRPDTSTWAPWWASIAAIAVPIPLVEPVTSAVDPLISNVMSPTVERIFWIIESKLTGVLGFSGIVDVRGEKRENAVDRRGERGGVLVELGEDQRADHRRHCHGCQHVWIGVGRQSAVGLHRAVPTGDSVLESTKRHCDAVESLAIRDRELASQRGDRTTAVAVRLSLFVDQQLTPG